MRIASVRLHRIRIPFKRAFAHAKSERSQTDAILVELVDEEGRSGFGEVLPRSYVTGETLEGVLASTGPAMAQRVFAARFDAKSDVLDWIDGELTQPQTLATLAGFELALLDVAGHALGFSAASVLGEHRGESLPPGIIVGFETPTAKLARHCAVLRLTGKRHVKVKVGLPDDLERLAAVTRVFGPDVPLRIDANMAWTVDEAMSHLTAMKQVCPLHSVEQPVAKLDHEGLRRIREDTAVPVMADESVCSIADAEALVAARACDIFNVRVGKHGGLRGSLAVIERAQAAGIALHLGTLVGETGILSRAGELLGRCVPGFDCLDGKGQNAFLLEQDVLREPSENEGDDSLEGPGLGVSVDPDRVADCRLGSPHMIRP